VFVTDAEILDAGTRWSGDPGPSSSLPIAGRALEARLERACSSMRFSAETDARAQRALPALEPARNGLRRPYRAGRLRCLPHGPGRDRVEAGGQPIQVRAVPGMAAGEEPGIRAHYVQIAHHHNGAA
jgi:hypothetical protein